ncbi:MAG: ATP-binding protein [Ktedonobacteraceae bacterium]|nr:ATP-binding protein [Ktedonobacteraceae bacterium]MBO0794980.1 ATP-binding protein [Ktedonobacteraceae bacterium]
MWLIAMKGFAGSGKSTLGRALSKQLGWPVIDKDDIRDLLDSHAQAAGPLAYEIMFNIARRQLLQGLNVICDSPLTGTISYEHAQAIAIETHASLAVLECVCSDESLWKQRIDGRKALQLPAHHQTDWDTFRVFLHQPHLQEQYPITHPHLVIDTAQPLHTCLDSVNVWLEHLQQPSHVGVRIDKACETT